MADAAFSFRTIDLGLDLDASLVYAHYRETHRASYGTQASMKPRRYLDWLRKRIEEFPDGHVLAYLGRRCVGQLELQVPYGLNVGYVNHYFVTGPFRGQGFGRLLHDYADRYFRGWEAERIELHVSPTNTRVIGFYQHMGYKLVRVEGRQWLMSRPVEQSVTSDGRE